jgi:hypothetical protein
MRKYKVREGFYVYKNETVFEPGTILDLSESEAEKYAIQIEEILEPKKKKLEDDTNKQVQN